MPAVPESCGPVIPSRVHRLQARTDNPRHKCRCSATVSSTVVRDASKGISITQRLLEAAPGGRSYAGLTAADKAWRALCQAAVNPTKPRHVIREVQTQLARQNDLEKYDVVVLGGTLGIFMATALLLRGYSVLVLERNQLRGRDQDWNISRQDMKVFADLGILTSSEVDDVITIEFNPVRISLAGSPKIEAEDILNCGVSPKSVLSFVKARFLAKGGVLREGATFDQAIVHSDGVQIDFTARKQAPAAAGGAGGEAAVMSPSYSCQQPQDEQGSIEAGVVVDAMGAWSPIAAQARGGAPPDSVVLMVGSCASGLPPAHGADLLTSFTPLNRLQDQELHYSVAAGTINHVPMGSCWQRRLQYFWECFPATDGLTTYMFCYADPHPGRASLEEMYDDYLELLPQYRGCASLEGVQIQRAVFGYVPNWHDQPLAPCTSRLLHIGDAAGNRSALSFAGFGALARHLGRLTEGLDAAMSSRQLSRGALRLLQPHSPAISLTAAMQFSMGTRIGQDFERCNPDIINSYIGSSFGQMKGMGARVYRPFMQDYLQFGSLARIVGGQLLTRPGDIVAMTLFMRSAKAGQMFATEFTLLGIYAALFRVAQIMDPVHQALLQPFPGLLFRWQRLVEAFEYGSANDFRE